MADFIVNKDMAYDTSGTSTEAPYSYRANHIQNQYLPGGTGGGSSMDQAARDAATAAQTAATTAFTTASAASVAISALRTQDTLKGRSIVAGCFNGLGTYTAQTSTGSGRKGYFALVNATDIRLTFGNSFNRGANSSPNYSDSDNPAAISGIKVYFEAPDGTTYLVKFGGQSTLSLGPGGYIQSDPLPIYLNTYDLFYVRVFMPASQSWYPTASCQGSNGYGGWVDTVDNSASGSIPDGSSHGLYMPVAITGHHLGSIRPVLGVQGNSIHIGSGDGGVGSGGLGLNVNFSGLGRGGYLGRACYAAKIPTLNCATGGDSLTKYVLPSYSINRRFFLSDTATVWGSDPRNDITGGASLATLQAAFLTEWFRAYNKGQRVLIATCTPLSATTDFWATTTNQSVSGNDSVRVAWNTWLRDGAPIDATSFAAVAVGTSSNVLRAGSIGHPLYTYFEVADLIETARNSGIWKAPVVNRTITDGAMAASGTLFTSNTANFTSGQDEGRYVIVPGAGASGAAMPALIVKVTSATQVTLSVICTTAVSGATVSIMDAYTTDGLHPSTYGAITASAAIDTSKII